MLEKIAGLLGASPTQYTHLLQTEKIVEKRANEGKHPFYNLSFGLPCVIAFLLSCLSGLVISLVPIDVFTYSLIGTTMSMLMIGVWTLPYFDILLSPVSYPVVAHTPVSSRTYFLVKLTQLLTYVVLLLVCLNLIPSICGIWIRGEQSSHLRYFFPIVYLPIVFMSGFFTVGVMTAFAGYLTKFYSKKGLRAIAKSAQFILPGLLPGLIILLPRDISADKIVLFVKWLYILPNGWFAGTVSLVLNTVQRPEFIRDLILGGIAIVSTLFLIFIPLRSIARSYAGYLGYLLESGSRQRDKVQMKLPFLARFFQSRDVYAGFCLSAAYMRRDRHILHQFASSVIGGGLLIGIYFARDMLPIEWIKYSYTLGLSPGFTIFFVILGVDFVTGFLNSVRYSDHWKASWMLSLPPLRVPHDLWRGVQAASLLYIIVPFTFLMFCIATVFWGLTGGLFVLPGLTLALYSIVLFPKPRSGIPLSREVIIKNRGSNLLLFLISLFASGILVGIQFVASLIHFWVYYGVYFVIVVGGLIGFIKFYKKESMKETSDA